MAGQDWWDMVTSPPDGGEVGGDLRELFESFDGQGEVSDTPPETKGDAGRTTGAATRKWPMWLFGASVPLIMCASVGYLVFSGDGSTGRDTALESSPVAVTDPSAGQGAAGGACASDTDTSTPVGVVVAFQNSYYAANAQGVRGVLAEDSPLHATDWESVLADVDTSSVPCVRVTSSTGSAVDAAVDVGDDVFYQRYRLEGDTSHGFFIHSIEKR